MKKETNKLSCAIVRDLLPLYHDGVVSGETRTAVNDHIASCGECLAELERLDTELPEVKESSGSRFFGMMKRQKTKRILKYTLCFAAGAVMIYGAIRFLCDFPIVKIDPELIDAKRVYRYEFDDCELEYCKNADSTGHGRTAPDGDSGFFVYCTMPAKTAVSVRSMKISRENGNVEMTFYRPIINTAARYYEDEKIYGDICTIPLKEGDRTLSINGRVVWEGGSPNEELPPYVEAYHLFEYGARSASWMIDGENEDDRFSFAYNGHRIEWDLDGNVIAENDYDYDDDYDEE